MAAVKAVRTSPNHLNFTMTAQEGFVLRSLQRKARLVASIHRLSMLLDISPEEIFTDRFLEKTFQLVHHTNGLADRESDRDADDRAIVGRDN